MFIAEKVMADLLSSPPEQLAFFQPTVAEGSKVGCPNSERSSHFNLAKSAAKVLGSEAALRSSKFNRQQLRKMIISHLKKGLREVG